MTKRNNLLAIFFGFLIGLIPLSSIQAETIEIPRVDSLLVQGSNVAFGNNTVKQYAQSVTYTTDQKVKAIQIYLLKNGSPTDNVLVDIVTDNSGVPSTTVLATAVKDGSSLTTTLTQYRLDFDTEVTLTASTQYWFRISRSSSLNDSNYYRTVNSTDGNSTGQMFRMLTTTWASVDGGIADIPYLIYYDFEYSTGGGSENAMTSEVINELFGLILLIGGIISFLVSFFIGKSLVKRR